MTEMDNLEQRYYWTPQWQAEEAETRRNLATGRDVHEFASIADAIAWLRSAP